MALIKSISGIRGTIGGRPGENLTAQDVVECTAAFGQWIRANGAKPRVVIGRDARISGAWMQALVTQTLLSLGIDVVDLGLSTTPTVEMAVPEEGAGAGIILTASHNPRQWNALKFLNAKGEFISAADGRAILDSIEAGAIDYADVDHFGQYIARSGAIERHIGTIMKMPLVHTDAVRKRGFKVVVDAVNSTGALSVPPLLAAMGCEVVVINGEPNGDFAHNPEPLPHHLTALCERVVAEKADLGIAVDPDVDRLAFVSENGVFFGEEYTLVAVADYVLGHRSGNTVSNLSSTRALRDVTEKHGGQYFASAVGEVNVVEKMKAVRAVIGGEGNGGVIVPDLHYGRDALAGIALFLSHLAETGLKMSELRATYPDYAMVKDKIALTPEVDLPAILEKIHDKYRHEQCNTIDGLKIDFAEGWVHLRKSNTEPIIRVYAESTSEAAARNLVEKIKKDALGG
ncbi:MAG: phosphoglucosamine mutase [Bacteroidetes bacterium]|nr:MAG: phosphoglucosamine mutase [Bacteroidota bacterium]